MFILFSSLVIRVDFPCRWRFRRTEFGGPRKRTPSRWRWWWVGRWTLKIADFLKGDESHGYMSYVPQSVGHELNQITYIDWRCMPLWLRNCLRQRVSETFWCFLFWGCLEPTNEATVSSSYWAGFWWSWVPLKRWAGSQLSHPYRGYSRAAA